MAGADTPRTLIRLLASETPPLQFPPPPARLSAAPPPRVSLAPPRPSIVATPAQERATPAQSKPRESILNQSAARGRTPVVEPRRSLLENNPVFKTPANRSAGANELLLESARVQAEIRSRGRPRNSSRPPLPPLPSFPSSARSMAPRASLPAGRQTPDYTPRTLIMKTAMSFGSETRNESVLPPGSRRPSGVPVSRASISSNPTPRTIMRQFISAATPRTPSEVGQTPASARLSARSSLAGIAEEGEEEDEGEEEPRGSSRNTSRNTSRRTSLNASLNVSRQAEEEEQDEEEDQHEEEPEDVETLIAEERRRRSSAGTIVRGSAQGTPATPRQRRLEQSTIDGALLLSRLQFRPQNISATPQPLKQNKPRATTTKSRDRGTKQAEILPVVVLKRLLSRMVKLRMSSDAFDAIKEGLSTFVKQVSKDLEAYATHSRRSAIEIEDVEMLFERQQLIGGVSRPSMDFLIHQYLPAEYVVDLIPVAVANNEIKPDPNEEIFQMPKRRRRD
eukprot:m.199865 g.199865  ORF g.199865 m.199865 type:complete len:507 (-) comp53806_c0_seq12:2442-3962(-)